MWAKFYQSKLSIQFASFLPQELWCIWRIGKSRPQRTTGYVCFIIKCLFISVHSEFSFFLGNLCGTSKQPQATAKSAFVQWTAAGMPASKLLLGLPLYGYVSKSVAKKLSGSYVPLKDLAQLPHPRSRPGSHSEVCNNIKPSGDLSSMWGQQIAFCMLVETGTLVKRSDGNYDAGNGYTRGKSWNVGY